MTVKRFILASVAAAALGAASAAGAAIPRSCPSLDGEFVHIRVTNTSCAVARDDVIFYTVRGEKPPGWACLARVVTESSYHWTCKHRGDKVVAYTLHV
jgi:hypothetical protein